MQIGTLTFVESAGGPLIVVPHRALSSWEGVRPPSNGRVVDVPWQFDPSTPATDYDRACNAPGLISTIPVANSEALILGSYTDNAAWLPNVGGETVGAFVRLISIDDGARFEQEMYRVLAEEPSPSELQWIVDDAVRLFDAASTNGGTLLREYIDVPLVSGTYAVTTVSYRVPTIAEAVVHSLRRM